MNEFLPYIIAGLAAGAVYGLAGAGLVITYKTSGIFNFAHPVLAAIGAYVFYFLNQDTSYFDARIAWPYAAIVAVLVAGPIMGFIMEWISRGLAKVTTSLQVLGTIGLALGVIGALDLFYSNANPTFNPFLSQGTFSIAGANVTWEQLILFVFSVVTVGALYVFFRVTRLGMAMRAVVDNPDLVSLTGTSSVEVQRWSWLIGATFAAASGVLLGSIVATVNAQNFFIFIVASFGAAALGMFKSLPLTFGGGLLIGVVGAIATKYETSVSWLSGLDPALPFIVLFVVLVLIKGSKLRDSRVTRPRPLPESYYGPWPVRLGSGLVIVGLLAIVPTVLPNDVSIWGSGLAYVIVILSLWMLVKESGQVSLCQTAFAAVGGVAFAHSVTQWGFPWLAAVVFAAVLSSIVGVLVAVPAIRVSGVFLALATLGFGLSLQNLLYPTAIMFTTSANGLPDLPRPSIASTQNAFYYLLLIATVLVALVMISIHFGRLGRLLRGLANSPLALNTLGTSAVAIRVIVFAISAFFAGLGGALYGSFLQGMGLETPLFQNQTALEMFAVVMLVAGGTPWSALQAGLALEVIPAYFSKWFPNVTVPTYLSLIFGVSSVGVATIADRAPQLPKPLQRLFERARVERSSGKVRAVAEVRRRPEGAGLAVHDLTVRFGGVEAVSHLDLHAPFARITGLIGPNGAGKTTTFNACSGLVKPSSGRVAYGDHDVSTLSPSVRARMGIGRTFQQAELWDALTVRENCALGREAPVAGRSPLAQLTASPAERERTAAAAAAAIELTGIGDLADRRVGDLSTGQRRLVELARVLAGPFDLLLLDEPSSGLDREETDRFGSLLQRVVAEQGKGILLVEHDMHLVMSICAYIHVMDFGQKIFEGAPTEVGTSDEVRAAYLGAEEVTVTTGADPSAAWNVEAPRGAPLQPSPAP